MKVSKVLDSDSEKDFFSLQAYNQAIADDEDCLCIYCKYSWVHTNNYLCHCLISEISYCAGTRKFTRRMTHEGE